MDEGSERMNDRQLYSFLKIAETGSFSKAAQDSYISVPAIVQQIDRLEDTLGVRLFCRTNQGTCLTEEGEIFRSAVLDMKQIYEQALTKIKEKKDSFVIGVAPNQCPEFLMDACAVFQKKHPQIQLHFAEFPYEEHLEQLRQGKMDLTLIAKPRESKLEGLVYHEIGRDTCAFGVNAGHALSGKQKIEPKDLAGITVLCGTYEYMELPFEQLLSGCKANLQVIPAEYNLEFRAQAKFKNAVLVFHSLWKNCYSHMFQVIPSDISAGSVGIVTRNGEEKWNAQINELIALLKQ